MIRQFLAVLAFVLVPMAAMPLTAGAYDAFPKVDCEDTKAQESTVCNTSTKDPISGEDGILMKATNIVSYLAGAFAIIMILVGSLRFITAGSDISTNSRTDTDVESARSTVVYALIGLAVVVLAKVIITYVILKLA